MLLTISPVGDGGREVLRQSGAGIAVGRSRTRGASGAGVGVGVSVAVGERMDGSGVGLAVGSVLDVGGSAGAGGVAEMPEGGSTVSPHAFSTNERTKRIRTA